MPTVGSVLTARECSVSGMSLNNLLKETFQVPMLLAGGKVLEVVEVNHLKLLAVATSEQTVYFYSLTELKLVMKLKLDSCGFNCMKYSEKFQILLVSGYENVTNVFSFTPQMDIQSVGRLVGHAGIVEAVEIIKDSVMAATADDKGVAKLWDLRKLACIQTVVLDNRSNIRSIMHLGNQDKVAFVGDRINSLMFEPDTAQTKVKEHLYPMAFDINEETGLLYIAMKSEVRVLSLTDGRVKRVFENLLETDQSDELTYFKFLPKRGVFILGDFNGRLGFFNATSSKTLHSLQPHSGAVTGINFDHEHEIVMTAGTDRKLQLLVELADLPDDQPDLVDDAEEREEFFGKPIMHQANMRSIIQGYNREEDMEKERVATEKARNRLAKTDKLKTGKSNRDLETLRSIEKVNQDTDVALAELSVYHNLVALATPYQKVYLYNYETFRPVSILEFQEDEDVTGIVFLTGYSKLAISTTKGKILFLSILFDSPTSVEVFLDFVIDVQSCEYQSEAGKKIKCSGYANKLLSDVSLSELGTQEMKSGEYFSPNKSLMHVTDQLTVQSAAFYVAESSGTVCCFNLQEMLAKETKYKPYMVNPNYNAFRKIEEDFSKLTITLQGKLVQLWKLTPRMKDNPSSTMNPKNFKAARELITHLLLSKTHERILMLTSLDCTFRMFTEDGIMLCHLNLNHPLPILWKFSTESLVNKTAKVVFALKMVEVMNQRYNKPDQKVPLSIRKLIEVYTGHEFKTFSMTSIDQEAVTLPRLPGGFTMKKLHSINVLLDDQSLKSDLKSKPKLGSHKHTQSRGGLDKPIASSQALLMRDLFTPKDIFFDRIKAQNREEVQGPSLKQLETIRRAKNILKMSDPLYGKSQEETNQLKKEEEDSEFIVHPSTLQHTSNGI
jgi:WD40 repeat protein